MNTLNEDVTRQTIKRITCEKFETFIIDFIDGHLTEEQQLIFNTHIEECDRCKVYIADYQKSIELSQAAFNKTNHASTSINENEIPEELVQAILKASKKNN